MNVSLYVHGFISFGAIVGGMIATSGDEAFVMLAQFPGTAMALFGTLFLTGIVFAWISDRLVGYLGIISCESCLEARCEECASDSNKRARIAGIFRFSNVLHNVKPLSFTRFLLMLFVGSLLFATTTGILGPASWALF
jgi:hypothetical protein